eukprot:TRINITY_DN2325_c0_g1_i1.p2 TRINITY_DN2325_c0_g1~~TRINITY_DN2325_c0_g1_i1.p2  ORF type:complete len:433 (-),score=220.36 TRINITY_DN2325_c0_g1_i1:21-1319(-)
MVASAVYLMDHKGKILISRNYRGDIPMAASDLFVSRLMEDEDSALKPVFHESGVSFVWIQHNGLYLMATTRRNSNATMVMLYLYRMVDVFREYFRVLNAEAILDNFVVCYELMDEMMDYGYPQSTEGKILQEYITQEGHKQDRGVAKALPLAVTGAVSWRKEGIKYRKNEVFLDVVESVNLLVSAHGTLLRSEIVGAIKLRCYLSGMPELKLGLNDRILFENAGRSTGGAGGAKAIEMEDVKFHQCVRLSQFESNRTIAFVPPDGEFELMSYRLSTQIRPLIWVEAVIEPHSGSRIEYLVKAKSQFKSRSTANQVRIEVPVPPDADSPQFKSSIGSVKYVPERDVIVWSIRQFAGQKEYLMRAHFGLPSISDEDRAQVKAPIRCSFEIPYYTTSGLSVRFLKVIPGRGSDNYTALPWVRYITQAGDYEIRLA